MWLDYSGTWCPLVILSLVAISEAGNYDQTKDGTVQRSSNFICREEGYHADSQNCMIYYRCVDFGNGGSLVKYQFECGPGTVFSKLKGDVCTHPYESGRKECDGSNDDSNKINDIDSNNIHETGKEKPGAQDKPESQPSPPPPTCPVCGPSYVPGSMGTTAVVTPSSVRPSQDAGSTTGWMSSTERITQAPNEPNFDTECKRIGFMADPYDCTKFYRCVDEGKHPYKRYEFNCGIGTIWDPKIDTCNHPSAVDRVDCKIPTGSNLPNEPSKVTVSTTPIDVTPSSIRPSQGTTGTTSGPLPDNENVTQAPSGSTSGPQCTCEGFMGDPQDCKKFYRCVNEGNGILKRYEFMCGIGTSWDPQISACNYPWESNRVECNSPSDSNPSDKPPYAPGSSTTDGHKPSSINPSQGNNDTGSSITSTESNNQVSSESSKPAEFPSSTSATAGVTPSSVDPSQENSNTGGSMMSSTESNNQVSNESNESSKVTDSTTAGVTPSTVSPSHEGSNTVGSNSSTESIHQAPTSGPQCTCTGFMADPQDCKKFYRCVDEGNGTYKRYEFACGIGTVWDQELQTCNHPWEVNRDACKVPTESNTSNEPPHLPGSTGTTVGVTSSSVHPSPQDSSTSSSMSSTESITQAPNEVTSSSSVPTLIDSTSDSAEATTPSSGSSSSESSSQLPPSEGASEVSPTDGSTGVPSEGSSEVSPAEVPSTEGAPEVPPSQGSSEVPSSQSSTNIPPSESSTQVSVSEETPDVPPSQITTEIPSTGDTSEVPTTGSSSEIPPSQSSSEIPEPQSSPETPSSQASSETPPSEVSSEVSPSGGSLSPGQGASEISQTTVPSTTSGSSVGSTTSSTQEIHCNELDQNCSNQQQGGSDSRCANEGFFANDNDCTKFYRCVNTGSGSYTRYDFDCGPGTAWDQKLLTCNHIGQVISCLNNSSNKPLDGTTSSIPAEMTSEPHSSTESSSSSSSSSSESTSSSSQSESTSSSSSESTSEQSSENSSTSKPCDKPALPSNNNGIVCNKEGFYAHPSYCNKFYRCVDNGNGFNVYHFDCPSGTIYDPSISVCNYPSSVYPSRDCGDGGNTGGTSDTSGTSENPITGSPIDGPASPVTEASTTPEGESAETSSNATPEETNTSSSEVTTGTSAETSTDSSQISTGQEEPSTGSTTDNSAEISTEVNQSTTSHEELTTIESSTGTESQSGTSTGDITENSTEENQSTSPEEQSSTVESTSSPQDGAESSVATTSGGEETTNDVIQSTTSQQEQSSTMESVSTTESGTVSSDSPVSTEEPTTLSEQQSTESQETTTVAAQQSTESITETTSSQPDCSTNNCNELPTAETVKCPIGNLTGEQIVLVCPTGFKQHPKYCNIFYQCTMDSMMEVKILTFHCPDNNIFDDKKIQCLPEDKASKPCSGVKAGARVYRRVEASPTTLINIEQRETLCPSEGYYPHNGQECSNVFYKCKKNESSALQGYLYKCPDNFVFWTVSRRCERASRLPMCSDKYIAKKNFNDVWKSRWQLPVEERNRSAKMLAHQ